MAVKTFAVGELVTATDANTYLANAGLVYITQKSVTNQSEITFDNCFTSTYLDYFVTMTVSSATSTNVISWQERAGGANGTTSYSYSGQAVYLSAGSGFQNILAGQNISSGAVGSFDGASGSQGFVAFDISAPQTSAYTAVTGRFSMATGNTGMYSGTIGSVHYVSTVYDGLRLFVAAGTFTATVKIYGYRQA